MVWNSCCRFASISDPGCRTLTMSLFALRSTLPRRVRGVAQSAIVEPMCGVPMKAIAVVDVKICLRCCCAAPREMRRACSTTRPPKLCATKMRGRWFCCKSVYCSLQYLVTRGFGRFGTSSPASPGHELATFHDLVTCWSRICAGRE